MQGGSCRLTAKKTLKSSVFYWSAAHSTFIASLLFISCPLRIRLRQF